MKVCCVCSNENSSYKCPMCKLPYCSVVCCKSHRESSCEPTTNESSTIEPIEPDKIYDFPTEDTVPIEKLLLLRGSQEVKNCLNNRHVRDIVMAILKDENPTRAIALGMTEPIFVELADACLKIVEPSEEEKSC